MAKGFRYFDHKHMQFNNSCAKCGTPTWIRDMPHTWYSGKKYYDLHTNKVVGVLFASGLTFCISCFSEIESSIDEG